MRGDLSDAGLETLFGELSKADATGALHLEGHTGPAKVFFRDGDVYYASSPTPRAQLGARLVGAGFIDDDELDRALAAQESGPSRTKLGAILVEQGMVRRDVIRVFVQEQILDAVFDLARWDRGTFEFFKGDAVTEDLPVQIPVGPLLMEVERRLSEWADIGAVIPSLDAVPDFVPSGSTTQAALEPDEFTLLTSVDGRRSIRELAHDLGYSQFDAARLIYGLSLLGVIAVPNGQQAPGEDDAPEPQARDRTVETPTDEPDEAEGGAPAQAQVEAEVEDEVEGDDEVDVGRALEEALFGMPDDEDEKVAEDEEDDGIVEAETDAGYAIDEEPTEDLEALAREAAQTVEEPAETDVEQPEQPVGSDDLEPDVWSASIDDEDVATGPEAAPESPPAADARNELIAMVGELQGEPGEADEADEAESAGVETEAEDDRPAARPDTGDDRAGATPDTGSVDAEDLGTVAPPPGRSEPEPPPTSASPERTERGDVSELLRELSRLAGGGPEPVAPSPDEPQDSDEEDGPDRPPGGRAEDASPPPERSGDRDDAEDDDGDHGGDDKRSTFRRLFGGSR